MKKGFLFYVSLAVLAVPFLSIGGERDTATDMKARIVQKIEEKQARLEMYKQCVQNAQTKDDLRACKEQYRQSRQSDNN